MMSFHPWTPSCGEGLTSLSISFRCTISHDAHVSPTGSYGGGNFLTSMQQLDDNVWRVEGRAEWVEGQVIKSGSDWMISAHPWTSSCGKDKHIFDIFPLHRESWRWCFTRRELQRRGLTLTPCWQCLGWCRNGAVIWGSSYKIRKWLNDVSFHPWTPSCR